jgi:hypothetical protein
METSVRNSDAQSVETLPDQRVPVTVLTGFLGSALATSRQHEAKGLRHRATVRATSSPYRLSLCMQFSKSTVKQAHGARTLATGCEYLG